MTRLIDADALKEYVGRVQLNSREKIFNLIDAQPTIDAVPVKHGKWTHYKDEHTCSKCGETVTGGWDEDYDYCPNCGARMDEE